ncbi:MAG: hypothetical protein FWG64_09310 [Firmicutes bacterium]|nr:hypothetical protein [Bacillota bacterium]
MEDNKILEEDHIITREEFARGFLRSYGGMLKLLQSGKPIKGNAREKVAEWKKMAEELDDE